MEAAGAADGDGQPRLALGQVGGDDGGEEAIQVAQELACDGLPQDEVAHGLGLAGMLTQLGAVERVLHEAHVEDEVGLQRHAVLEAEADDLQGQLVGTWLRPQRIDDALAQLLEGEAGGVDGRLRHLADLVEQGALARDRRADAVVLVVERVPVPSLRVAPDEDLVAGLEEDDLGFDVTAVERSQGRCQRHRRITLAHVQHDGHAVVARGVVRHELGEVSQQLDGHVVDDGVAEVLEDLAGGRLPGPREPGDDGHVLVARPVGGRQSLRHRTLSRAGGAASRRW